MPGHPYAQRAVFTQYHNAPPVHEHATHSHKGSEYAGPHPSTLEAAFPPNTATSDVSKRHRLPPRAAMPHPYANFGQDPTTPRTGEDSQFPPSNAADISEYRDKAFSTNAHISLTNPEFSNFGVGEALVYAVQKTASKGSGLGGSEERGIVNMERVRSRVAEPPSKEVSDKGKGRELSLSVLHIDSGYPSGRPIFHSDEFPSSPTPLTNYRRTQMSSSMDNMPEVASSFDDTLTRLILPALANGDDLDDFRDLFYKPRPRNVSRTPTSDDPSKGIPSDVHSSRSGSGLTNLVRKLSEELEELKDVSSPSAGALDSESRGGREEQQSGHPSTTQGFFFSDFSGSPSSSPVQADGPSPFRLPIQKDRVPPGAPDANIPEDVESSRASSILERANEENDTFGVPIRVGQIAAMATSPVSFSPHRVSSQLSIIGGEAAHTGPTSQTFTPRSGRNSLHPHSAEPLRSSYATSTTDLSRMSGLSDFPVPPAQVNLTSAHMSILQGYFESVARQSGDPTETRATSRIRSGHRDSHRTTFGGSEDMDIITQVHAAET
ncbi:hypothetical protein SERLA73DRAFT_175753 [Serpula lacrymans var. lacrymans S7.3]|uniref:Uncharacterized protein n=2 Tax=Serpula lacrymans var. lacrymans TaxID=341189 RepID=F8PLB3_SERL3|nr:uncharacterized protein SERLADRAFT_458340 [Serpula lacrymans var. lacrymans S7.9]EGO04021.1 hypothetical protein SERLA73DRAFT_175753 [Serpula lacrymans var. lacrymans S7.3]EGO29939.1 hypothetical protein SERLADRAFT_458340 [Serpula lacrymans var. lacrymans S7.9]